MSTQWPERIQLWEAPDGKRGWFDAELRSITVPGTCEISAAYVHFAWVRKAEALLNEMYDIPYNRAWCGFAMWCMCYSNAVYVTSNPYELRA